MPGIERDRGCISPHDPGEAGDPQDQVPADGGFAYDQEDDQHWQEEAPLRPELGDLHAERAALADCAERGNDPAGATIYVTLEPCAHQGRQPPCVEAILEAGIARVVIASDDPSEKAAGRGPGILRDGGVEVEFAAGEQASAARLLNQAFRKHARVGGTLAAVDDPFLHRQAAAAWARQFPRDDSLGAFAPRKHHAHQKSDPEGC